MSARRNDPYTPEQDRLILACPTGELKALAERLGRQPVNVRLRRAKLRAEETSMPTHYALGRRREGARSFRPPPFARPDWFDEEDLDAMSRARR